MPNIETTVAGEAVKINYLPWPEHVDKWDRFCASDQVFGLDVETTAIEDMGAFNPDARLRLIQFGSLTEAWCLDPHNDFWRERVVTFLNSGKRFVSHTNYDPLWCNREFGTPVDERWIDTLPMASLLWPGAPPVGLPKDLKSLTDRQIDSGLVEAATALTARFRELAPLHHRVGKKMAAWGFTNIELTDEVFARYGGLDAIYVRRLLPILAGRLRACGMAVLSLREQAIQRLATNMQIRGLLLDTRHTQRLLDAVEANVKAEREWLEERWGFSALSPKRGQWLLDHGAQVTEYTPSGLAKLTMDSAAGPGTLPVLAESHAHHPLGKVFAHMVGLASGTNFYNNLRDILANRDQVGFVHPRINTQAAVTGRQSIVSPAMQTFNKTDLRLRRCFIARPGHVLVGADYDGQEIRIAAAFSRDPALLKIVNEGLSQHDVTAESLFGKGFTPAQRAIAKTIGLGQQYGLGPKKLSARLNLYYDEALELWLGWRETYAGLVEWTEKMSENLVVVNPWGRRIPRDAYRFYTNGNYAIQSTGRDVLGDAMIKLADDGWGDCLWLPVHDELILEVPEAEAEVAAQALEAAMYCEIRGVPLTAKAKILGTRWSGETDV